MARLADTLVALTENQFLWREPGTDVLDARVRHSRRSSADWSRFTPFRDGFFVAGEQGVGYATLNSAPQSPLLGQEHTWDAFAMSPRDPEFLWVGTERGVVRWRIRAILP
jgi:hypothetical protein